MLIDRIFQASLVLTVLFFGISVAYYFGMGVKQLMFDVKDSEERLSKSESRNRKLLEKIEQEKSPAPKEPPTPSTFQMQEVSDGFIDEEEIAEKEETKKDAVILLRGQGDSGSVPTMEEAEKTALLETESAENRSPLAENAENPDKSKPCLDDEEATALLSEDEDATALLTEDEDATALLTEDEDATALLTEDEEATALLTNTDDGQA